MTDSLDPDRAPDTRLTSPWLHVWDDEVDRAHAPAPAPAPRPRREGVRPGALAPWWRAGARAAALQPVHGLQALQATPAVAALLMLASLAVSLLLERLAIPGPASFDARALLTGWLDTVVIVWLCAWIRPPGMGVLRLVCLTLGTQFVIHVVTGSLWVAMARGVGEPSSVSGLWLAWALWLASQLWWLLAMALVFRRSGDGHLRPWLLSVVVLVALLALQGVAPASAPWSAIEMPHDEQERPSLSITEPVLQAQATLLERQLTSLRPQRPGVVDVYVITFAPYGEEDVFSRESAMVAEVMARRFDAQGRVLQLVNHPATAEQLPWATANNLAQAVRRLGQVMDPSEDLLFIHLTSHGARNGHLAAGLWPLALEQVTPQALKGWLDASNIRRRVISISACYSGSWIAPLATDDSLVMTAADADHTSYGCGRRSPLTFFGRAMYDEQLRTQTLSFADAHAAAREVIRQREIDGGKDDGYSNPQIKVGPGLAPVLEALRQRLSKQMPDARPGIRPAASASPR